MIKKQELWIRFSSICLLLLLPCAYACDFDVTDYYYDSLSKVEQKEYRQILEKNTAKYLRQKNVTLYEDFPEGPMGMGHILFLKAGKLYVYGQPVFAIDPKNYQYLGHGFFRHQDKIYFMKTKVAAYIPNQRIQTYTERAKPENRTMVGTSCEGVFDVPTYYLKTSNMLYQVTPTPNSDGEVKVISSKLAK